MARSKHSLAITSWKSPAARNSLPLSNCHIQICTLWHSLTIRRSLHGRGGSSLCVLRKHQSFGYTRPFPHSTCSLSPLEVIIGPSAPITTQPLRLRDILGGFKLQRLPPGLQAWRPPVQRLSPRVAIPFHQKGLNRLRYSHGFNGYAKNRMLPASKWEDRRVEKLDFSCKM